MPVVPVVVESPDDTFVRMNFASCVVEALVPVVPVVPVVSLDGIEPRSTQPVTVTRFAFDELDELDVVVLCASAMAVAEHTTSADANASFFIHPPG